MGETIITEKIKHIRKELDELEKYYETELDPYIDLIKAVEEKKTRALTPPIILAKQDPDVLPKIMAKLDHHDGEIRKIIAERQHEPVPANMEEALIQEREKKARYEKEITSRRGISWLTGLGAALLIFGVILLVSPETVRIYQPLGYIPALIGVFGGAIITIDLWKGKRQAERRKAMQTQIKKPRGSAEMKAALMGGRKGESPPVEEIR